MSTEAIGNDTPNTTLEKVIVNAAIAPSCPNLGDRFGAMAQ
jgi:hypothetical protein